MIIFASVSHLHGIFVVIFGCFGHLTKRHPYDPILKLENAHSFIDAHADDGWCALADQLNGDYTSFWQICHC